MGKSTNIQRARSLAQGFTVTMTGVVVLNLTGCGNGLDSAGGFTNSSSSQYAASGPASTIGRVEQREVQPLEVQDLNLPSSSAGPPLPKAGQALALASTTTASFSYARPVEFSTIQINDASGLVYTANPWNNGAQPTPPIPPISLASGVTFVAKTTTGGNISDDGVTLSLAGITNSGTLNGTPFVNSDGSIITQELTRLADGSLVMLSTSTRYPSASGGNRTDLARGITVSPPTVGVTISNATSAAFDPASGQNATLNFDILPTGTPAPAINQWTVSVVQSTNTTNQPFYVFPAGSVGGDSRGPGTVTSLSRGVHVNLPWNGKNSQNQMISGDFTWVMATNVTAGGPPGSAGQATLRLDQIQKSLKINGVQDPSNYDPRSGGNVTLNFDLESQGLGSSPTFEWNVAIADAQGSQLFAFPKAQGSEGPGNATSPSGSSRRVSLKWNGIVSNGQPVVPDFKWVISATATRAAGDTQIARAEVLNSSNPAELLVQAGGTERAHAYSPSTTDLEKSIVDPLLRRIFNANETYTIRATGLRFEGQRPNTIVAEIKSNVSGRTLLKTLTFSNTTQAFSGSFQSNEVIQARPATTLYSTVAGDEPDFESVANLWGNLIGGSDTESAYPGPKAKVGQLLARLALFDKPDHSGLLDPALAPTVDLADADPVTGQTTDDSKNFFQYGFESITVKLKDESGALQTKDLQTLQRVGHAADVVVINCHGAHTGELSINPNPFFATLAPKPPLGAKPRQLVFLSCAALDLRDYNNSFDLAHFSPDQGGHPSSAGLFQNTAVDPDTGITYRFTPRASYGGEAWFRSFAGQTVLLGYNADVVAPAVAAVTSVYRRRIAQGEKPIIAWLRSNRDVGLSTSLGGLGWSAFNACAYDTNGDYYYIAYSPPSGDFTTIAPLAVTAGDVLPLGIYKVPASKWALQADNWAKPLQTSNGTSLATRVE